MQQTFSGSERASDRSSEGWSGGEGGWKVAKGLQIGGEVRRYLDGSMRGLRGFGFRLRGKEKE